MIPFIDLSSRNIEFADSIREAIDSVVRSGVFVGGQKVKEFEDDFARYLGAKYCVGVGNGLDALRLSLLGLGIEPGSEVIVPAQTFIATWLAVVQIGAKPIPVDVLFESGNINPELVQDALGPKTSAIIATHLHGRPADMPELSIIAQRHGIPLIEDAAQAHGAQIAGRKTGTWGSAGAFSFYPTKNLGALGDAGCVVTDDAEVARRIRSLRSYGADPANKYQHEVEGWNSRLDPIQAAVLQRFLPHLDHWNDSRRQLARRYLDASRSFSCVEVLDPLIAAESSVWHHFVVRSQARDDLRRRLDLCGIATEIHYPQAPFMSPAFSQFFPNQETARKEYPVASALADTVLSLPLHPWLGADIDQVIQATVEISND